MLKANIDLSQDVAILNTTLLSTLDEALFFNEISRFIRESLITDRVFIFQAKDESTPLLISIDGKITNLKTSDQSNQGVAAYVMRTKRAYYSNCVGSDPLFANENLDKSVKAELCVPISSQGIVLGTIHFQYFTEDKKFNQEDINQVLSILTRLEKPVSNMKMYLSAKQLNEALKKKLEKQEKELEEHRCGVNTTTINGQNIEEKMIIGSAESLQTMLKLVDKVAPTNSTVLVSGESGTGKELIARRIHCNSHRKNNPYVIVNCGTLQENLLESELFGHEEGAFTGAIASKPGLVETAHNGTLFLDEIGEICPAIQAKLLRFIQEGEAVRVGGNKPYRVNVRIISATNRDLRKAVEEGKFREDLYFRLNTISITVPSLMDRVEDIKVLANHFLNFNRSIEEQKFLTQGAINVLSSYSWPGNIRELINVIERAYILSDGKYIDESQLPETLKNEQVRTDKSDAFSELTLEALEKQHICKTLGHLKGNKTKTAKMLGITVKTLYNKLHSYGMIESRNSLS